MLLGEHAFKTYVCVLLVGQSVAVPSWCNDLQILHVCNLIWMLHVLLSRDSHLTSLSRLTH